MSAIIIGSSNHTHYALKYLSNKRMNELNEWVNECSLSLLHKQSPCPWFQEQTRIVKDILEILYNILPLLENTAWWKIQKSTKIKLKITHSLATQRKYIFNILMYIFLVFLCIYILIKYDIYAFMYIYSPTHIHI